MLALRPVKTLFQRAARRMPVVGKILRERDLLHVPPGHFYSPIPSGAERAEAQAVRAKPLPRTLPGIDLNEGEQLALFDDFARMYPELPWGETPTKALRYHFSNDAFDYCDAICLYAMLRHAKPRRVIEVGCGYSSCVTLDTNELFFGGAIETVFVEPYPDLLYRLMKPGDRGRSRVLEKRLQDVPVAEFERLEAGDILFIDSTHVAKANSDVNYAFASIFPALAPGVLIHVHDVHYPFEYPAPWLREGRGWNELYMLRAFLQYNERFRIAFFNTFMVHFHRERFAEKMPRCLKSDGGSIWLRVADPKS
jgi:hypothetical protein